MKTRSAGRRLSAWAFIVNALRAGRTLDPEDWSRLADQWHALTHGVHRPASLSIITGHMLIAGERFEEAEKVLQEALLGASPTPRALMLLARAKKATGQRAAAITLLQRAWHAGAREAAARALCRLGARGSLPVAEQGIFPVNDYAGFIATHPVQAPPALSTDIHFQVRVDGRGGSVAALETTLRSLSRQKHRHWTGEVLLSPGATLATVADDRLSECRDIFSPLRHDDWTITLPAGVWLDQNALAWLAYAVVISPCEAVFSDHDHHEATSNGHLMRRRPVFHPMADATWHGHPRNAPLLFASRGLADDRAVSEVGSLFGQHAIAHVPRILASRPATQQNTYSPDGPEAPPAALGRISVVIPSRDNPALLEKCIETLQITARDIGRIEILIVDNGSVNPDTIWFLDELRRSGKARVVDFPEPFNWSRANNLGAAEASGEHLLFLNDDTEMLTSGWDDLLVGLLEQEPRIGIVGARLLYPHGTVQHAGFIFGLDSGPEHEGRWQPADASGPEGRWLTARQATAVTGAFMAMRRSVLEQVGMFDEENYAVDFSDIDLCLRVRAAGLAIIYQPEIELIHHESVSRGYNRSRAKRARAQAEQASLRRAWGDAIDHDPGYNPHWSRVDYPFDGYREPSLDEIVAHIKKSASPSPWSLEPRAAVTPDDVDGATGTRLRNAALTGKAQA